MDARNMYRREINILTRIVHLVGLISKIIHGCTVNKTYKKKCYKSLRTIKSTTTAGNFSIQQCIFRNFIKKETIFCVFHVQRNKHVCSECKLTDILDLWTRRSLLFQHASYLMWGLQSDESHKQILLSLNVWFPPLNKSEMISSCLQYWCMHHWVTAAGVKWVTIQSSISSLPEKRKTCLLRMAIITSAPSSWSLTCEGTFAGYAWLQASQQIILN